MENKRVIALGTFDGIHKGHRALLKRAWQIAEERGLGFMIYTFSEHPLALFDRTPRLLMKNEERIQALHGFGGTVTAVQFTAEYAAMRPAEFARVLAEEYGAAVAVAGFNYTFGSRGEGDVTALRGFGEKLGFEVCEIPPEYYDGAVVSSTRIRACLEAGDVEDAGVMLTGEYAMSGFVVKNRQIGSGMGYPTANLGGTGELVVPAAGVYATYAEVGGICRPAVTNIGKNPTVEGRETTIETHIIDFDGDIYGEAMRVRFVKRLRGEITFPNVKELAGQIAHDAEIAREILS